MLEGPVGPPWAVGYDSRVPEKPEVSFNTSDVKSPDYPDAIGISALGLQLEL